MQTSRTVTALIVAVAALACLPLASPAQTPQATTPLQQQAQDYASAKTAADADEASLDATTKQTLERAQGTLVDAGVADCATPNPDFSAFVVVMALAADGRVQNTWRRGESPLAICLERYVRGKLLFVPPRAPFHAFIEISFSK